MRTSAAALLLALAAAAGAVSAQAPATEDARGFVQLVEDNDANCVRWEGRLVMVRNTHPTRAIRVWLERDHMGKHTGDRSRTDLPANGEPEKLGCSRTQYGTQAWRVVRAEFLD